MNSKLALRIVTALIGIPALVWLVGRGGVRIFSSLIFLVTLVCLWEYYRIAFPARPREQAGGIIAGLLVGAGVLTGWPSTGLAGVTVLLFCSHLFFGGRLEERFNRLCWTILGTVYIGFLVPHAALLYRLPDGPQWIFFVLLVVMAGDTAAYLVGTTMGRRKLYPEISPGKTVEGAIGSTAASLIVGAFAGPFLLPSQTWSELLGISIVLSVLGQVGDLFESWIKRVFGVKDSSALIPGHGGLLDRMDSLIFPLVFAAYCVRLFHP
ncbi:MAG: phosphatidate cytidylyltransferase [Candidatus Binatia bacterium]